MRINAKDTLFDIPVLKVREVIRLAMQERLSDSKKENIFKVVAKTIGASDAEGKRLFNTLLEEKYLNIKNKKWEGSNYWMVTETEKGRHLAVTRANPPITREKADNLLKEILERIKQINDTPEYVYKVSSAKIFGSYLSEKEILGDLDIAVKLDRKVDGAAFMELCKKRIELAYNTGRNFSNYIEQLDWPRREVLMHLSTRKKGLSIHIEGEDDILTRVQYKVVYEER